MKLSHWMAVWVMGASALAPQARALDVSIAPAELEVHATLQKFDPERAAKLHQRIFNMSRKTVDIDE